MCSFRCLPSVCKYLDEARSGAALDVQYSGKIMMISVTISSGTTFFQHIFPVFQFPSMSSVKERELQ